MACIGNPAYSFRPILLKLYRYFAAFLWFHMRNLSLAGYNCSGGASCMACSFIYWSFWNFEDVFFHGVRMCMWFGYNCWIIFYHFFHFVNLVIFQPLCIDSGYLVSATPRIILYQSFWNFAHVLSMVAYGLDIILAFIFVTFSTLRTLLFSDLRFCENVVIVGTLWAQLLIQFYTDLYETLHMFLPWSGDVHVVRI